MRNSARKAKNKICAMSGTAVEMLVKAKTPATKVASSNPKVSLSIYFSWEIDLLQLGPGDDLVFSSYFVAIVAFSL
jgi:hypothetical protein